jgi:hypothetical protein
VKYPEYGGQFARVVTHGTEYAQSLIDDFSIPEKAPHIAISVDMLDTGIDVPEVVNLVFFKLVRSKTKIGPTLVSPQSAFISSWCIRARRELPVPRRAHPAAQ